MGEHLPAPHEPGIIRKPGVVGGSEEFIANTYFHVLVQGALESAHSLIGERNVGVARP